jgi:hypothetical protein
LRLASGRTPGGPSPEVRRALNRYDKPAKVAADRVQGGRGSAVQQCCAARRATRDDQHADRQPILAERDPELANHIVQRTPLAAAWLTRPKNPPNAKRS